MTLLLAGAELGEDDAAFSQLIAVARERLQRPWQSAALDAATVNKALGEKASAVQAALLLSDQIGPILASGTQGNPRQIKRFLNSLILRQRTAQARGFGDEVNLPVLGKLMLAERFLPRLFDQIGTSAASAPDGRCKELVELEAASEQSQDEGMAVRPDSKVGRARLMHLTTEQPETDRPSLAMPQPAPRQIAPIRVLRQAHRRHQAFQDVSPLPVLISRVSLALVEAIAQAWDVRSLAMSQRLPAVLAAPRSEWGHPGAPVQDFSGSWQMLGRAARVKRSVHLIFDHKV